MNQIAQWNLSGIGCSLLILLGVMGLSALGFGWIINSVFVIVVGFTLLPILAAYGLRWWVKRNIVEDQCPMCSHPFAALNPVDFSCPNCGEALQIKNGRFVRITPPGTIDVDAVEVDVQVLED